MKRENLEKANEINERIHELKDNLYLSSRESTEFSVRLTGLPRTIRDKKWWNINDAELTAKLLTVTCDHIEKQIKELEKQFIEL